MTPRGHPDRAARYSRLGDIFEWRYRATKSLPDFHSAINISRTAIIATLHNEYVVEERQCSLHRMLERIRGYRGEIADLNESIQSSSQAVNSTAENSPYLTERLEELGLKLQRRYRASFELHDIRKGILLYKRTLNASTDHEDYLREQCLSYLSKDRETRYQLLRGIPDLHKGIFLARKVTTPTTMDTFLVEDLFNDLGEKLKLLYGVTHTIDHLNEANEWLDKAAKSEAIREEIRCSDEFDA